MRIWILVSSVLAILGGVLFLVLPVAFLNGIVSVIQPPPPACYGYCHLIEIYGPLSIEMAAFSVILGGVGILLGLLVLAIRVWPREYLTWGLPFSLGSESLLIWIVTLYIQGKFIVSPSIYSAFLSIATIAMVGSTLLLIFGLAMSNNPRTIDNGNGPREAGQILWKRKKRNLWRLWVRGLFCFQKRLFTSLAEQSLPESSLLLHIL